MPAVRNPLRRVKRAPRQKREAKNDQVDCCCWLCLGRRNLGAGHYARVDSSAGRHDDSSRFRLRSVQDPDQWGLRGQNYGPPDSPSRPQVSAVAERRLRPLTGERYLNWLRPPSSFETRSLRLRSFRMRAAAWSQVFTYFAVQCERKRSKLANLADRFFVQVRDHAE